MGRRRGRELRGWRLAERVVSDGYFDGKAELGHQPRVAVIFGRDGFYRLNFVKAHQLAVRFNAQRRKLFPHGRRERLMERFADSLLPRLFLQRIALHHAVSVFQIIRVVAHIHVAVSVRGVRWPDMLAELGLAAVAGGIKTRGQRAAINAAKPPRFRHGLLGKRAGCRSAAIRLIVCGIFHVVCAGGTAFAQRIRPGGDGLCLERFEREGVAHFKRNNAEQIILHVDGQDGTNGVFNDVQR